MRARPSTNVTFEVSLVLTEHEARALDAVCGYGTEAFLIAFYQKMGRAYLEPYERGFRSLADAVLAQIRPQLSRIEEARAVLRGDRTQEWMYAGAMWCIALTRMGEAIAARQKELGVELLRTGCI